MNPSGDSDLLRYEEQLRVSTETVPVEIVRIEKFIVTEQRTSTVDVRREELRITREPVTGADPEAAASSGVPAMPIVIILREEKILITKTVVPAERVTVDVVNVSKEGHVNETLRREQIDVVDTDLSQ